MVSSRYPTTCTKEAYDHERVVKAVGLDVLETMWPNIQVCMVWYGMVYYAMLCYAMLWCGMLCYAMLWVEPGIDVTLPYIYPPIRLSLIHI